MARTRTSWTPGAPSPNPKGRPKGARDTFPKIRLLLAQMVTSEDPALRRTLAECLRSKDHVTRVLGLYSKLNHEHPVPQVVLDEYRRAPVALTQVNVSLVRGDERPQATARDGVTVHLDAGQDTPVPQPSPIPRPPPLPPAPLPPAAELAALRRARHGS
jgi:hypothetical protein